MNNNRNGNINLINRRNLWKALAGSVAVITATLSFSVMAEFSNADAMNEAGKQRMLSQRTAKAWLMLGMNVNTDEAAKELDESVASFEKNFLDLQDFASTAKVEKSLDDVNAIWQQYRILILSKPDKTKAVMVLQESDKLLTASEKLVSEIEAYTNIHAAKLVNISGRQRMLSQRLSKLYMAQAWGIDSSNLNKSMQKSISEFENALALLHKSSLNTPSINKKLKKVDGQWRFSKAGFQMERSGSYVPTVISVTTESILKKMDTLTAEYAAEMKQQVASR